MRRKKSSANFRSERRRTVKKRRKINPYDVINLTFQDYTLALIGQPDVMAWNAMDRKEKRKHVLNLKNAVAKGLIKNLSVTYDDPKAFDNTPQQAAKYKERSLQIATELFYVFSMIQ